MTGEDINKYKTTFNETRRKIKELTVERDNLLDDLELSLDLKKVWPRSSWTRISIAKVGAYHDNRQAK